MRLVRGLLLWPSARFLARAEGEQSRVCVVADPGPTARPHTSPSGRQQRGDWTDLSAWPSFRHHHRGAAAVADQCGCDPVQRMASLSSAPS